MLAPIMSWMDEPKALASPAQTVMFRTCLEAATTRAVEPSGSLEDVRIRRANRSQVVMGPTDLDSQLPADDSARAIWAVVQRLDLSALYAQIISRRGSLSRFRGHRFYAALDAESKRNSYSMGLRYSSLECRRLRL